MKISIHSAVNTPRGPQPRPSLQSSKGVWLQSDCRGFPLQKDATERGVPSFFMLLCAKLLLINTVCYGRH